MRFPSFGQRTAAALSGVQGQLDVDFIATILINEIYDTIPEHFLLVLDDYHLVNDNTRIRRVHQPFLTGCGGKLSPHYYLPSLLSLPDSPIMSARLK